MSWYNTVILSFSSDEFEDERDVARHDCKALRSINAWLKTHHYEALADLNPHKGGRLGSNAVLFGGCYNYLDVGELTAFVSQQKWKHRDDVQILFWDDNASKCSLIQPRFSRSASRNSASKKARRMRGLQRKQS